MSQPAISTKTVLHVGCGSKKTKALHWSFKDWHEITVDVDERCQPDIVASITSMPQVETESVDAVFAAHVLEHVAFHEIPLALSEFQRVLRHDGDLLLQLPDLQQACAAVAEGRPEQYLYQSPGGPIAPLDIIFGHRWSVAHIGPAMAHRSGFTQRSLQDALYRADFEEIKVWVEGFDLWATAQKAVS
jgi:ubiquinone/menaquinone biosynthesis C-methylase UbiE